MMNETNLYDYIANNGVECPAGLSLRQLDKVTQQLLISNCMYDNGVGRYEAIEHLEAFSYDSEGNTMGYL